MIVLSCLISQVCSLEGYNRNGYTAFKSGCKYREVYIVVIFMNSVEYINILNIMVLQGVITYSLLTSI